MDKHWRVKIGDFNLSRVENTQEKTTSITANNPRWLAPEVISKQVTSTWCRATTLQHVTHTDASD